MKINSVLILLLLCASIVHAQHEIDSVKALKQAADSLYILEIEQVKGQKAKVLHAEPLYIDLIRDLGARKGEKEWNVGMGLTDKLGYDSYETLVEYEWAPIDRLGLEVEVPFTFYTRNSKETNQQNQPSDRIESLKTAIQWSFLVSEKWSTTLAVGYINELELVDLNSISRSNLLKGNIYNPFFVAAKRWGNNFHTLIYTGPMYEQNFYNKPNQLIWQHNSNFHYMIPGTRNFIGIEANKLFNSSNFDLVVRPQMRLELTKKLMVGIVSGIPIGRGQERLSSFIRLIYEPGH